MKNGARTQSGRNFRDSVAKLWPGFAQAYNAKIPNQMDLLIIEKKLKDGLYPNIQAIKEDVQLLYDNTLAFNGLGHFVERAAMEVKNSLSSKLDNVTSELAPVPKEEKKVKRKIGCYS